MFDPSDQIRLTITYFFPISSWKQHMNCNWCLLSYDHNSSFVFTIYLEGPQNAIFILIYFYTFVMSCNCSLLLLKFGDKASRVQLSSSLQVLDSDIRLGKQTLTFFNVWKLISTLSLHSQKHFSRRIDFWICFLWHTHKHIICNHTSTKLTIPDKITQLEKLTITIRPCGESLVE